MRITFFATSLLLGFGLLSCTSQTFTSPTPLVTIFPTHTQVAPIPSSPVEVRVLATVIPTKAVNLTVEAYPTRRPIPSSVSAAKQPDFGSDLLIAFASDHGGGSRLVRYENTSGELLPILDVDVVSVKLKELGAPAMRRHQLWVNTAGTRAYMLYSQTEIATEGDVILFSIDLEKNALIGASWLPRASKVGGTGPYPNPADAFMISPNGDAIAYFQRTQTSIAMSGKGGSGVASPLKSGFGISGSVQVIQLTSSTLQPIKLAECGVTVSPNNPGGCQALMWSSQAQSIAMKDERGLWILRVGQTAQMLPMTYQRVPLAPNSLHNMLSWSPDDQYVLASMVLSEQPIFGIVNVNTGQVTALSSLDDGIMYWNWLRDGRLISFRGSVNGTLHTESDLTAWAVDSVTGQANIQYALPLDPRMRIDGWHENSSGDLLALMLSCFEPASIDSDCEYLAYQLNIATGQIKSVLQLPNVPRPYGYRATSIRWLKNTGGGFFEGFNTTKTLTRYWISVDVSVIELKPPFDAEEMNRAAIVVIPKAQ